MEDKGAIWKASKAISFVRTSPDVIQFNDDVQSQNMSTVTATVEGKLHEAFALDRQQMAMLAELKLLREKWDHEIDPGPRLIAMRPVEQKRVSASWS